MAPEKSQPSFSRMLTKRDKSSGPHRRDKSRDKLSDDGKPRATLSGGVFPFFKPSESKNKEEKDEKIENKKVQVLKQRLRDNGRPPVEDAHVEYALRSMYAGGDSEKAYEMIIMFQEALAGIITPYDPNVKMLGAINRKSVTCWLDSLLFSMFAKMDSFEAMLWTEHEGEAERRLAALIRLWVNMLRSGKLIPTDLTQHIQETLAACGWEEAAEVEQQDASEAFCFITERLNLPLITLEVDTFHAGGDDSDDHKFINERLLDVGLVDHRPGERLRLEDCLEAHMNVRVQVKRRLERRNTLEKGSLHDSASVLSRSSNDQDGYAEHVEVTEIDDPDIDTPLEPSSSLGPSSPVVRVRAPSIMRSVDVSLEKDAVSSDGSDRPQGPTRKGSLRREVNMQAWQFFRVIRPSSPIFYSDLFKLQSSKVASNRKDSILIGDIAWYTDNTQMPTSDHQVAAHFNKVKPVLGICLKRYRMNERGQPMREDTIVDIPLQFALPHFIKEDKDSEGNRLFAGYKMVLQSIVCHRGNSVNAGHYVSVGRVPGKAVFKPADSAPGSQDGGPPEYTEDRWIKHDDLHNPRIEYVDIQDVLTNEMPYVLFYQVQPQVDQDDGPEDDKGRLPSYEDSVGDVTTVLQEATPIDSKGIPPLPRTGSYFDAAFGEPARSRISFSDDVERPRKSLTLPDSSRRGSLADASSVAAYSMPPTPNDENVPLSGRLSRAASRFSRTGASRSRPSSHADEGRISATLARLSFTKSKDPLRPAEQPLAGVIVPIASADGPAEITTIEAASDEATADSTPRTAEKQKESKSHQHHHHHRHVSKDKGKGKEKEKDQQGEDRECIVM